VHTKINRPRSGNELDFANINIGNLAGTAQPMDSIAQSSTVNPVTIGVMGALKRRRRSPLVSAPRAEAGSVQYVEAVPRIA
jgi:hypothetical protein